MNYDGKQYSMIVVQHPTNKHEMVELRVGVSGYTHRPDREEEDDIPEAVKQAFLVGSMFGWEVSGANPNIY